MVVSPAENGASAAPTQRPVLRTALKPEQELLVMASLETGMGINQKFLTLRFLEGSEKNGV